MLTNSRSSDNPVVIQREDVLNPADQTRLQHFKKVFQERTKTDIQYLVRAPGRVNIIGDHIDYHGFAVLPMAIENSIWLGCSFELPSDGDQKCGLNISNMNQESYPTLSCQHSLLHGSELDRSHEWYHYILCGYHGVLANKLLNIKPEDVFQHAKDTANLEASNQLLANLKSFNMVIDSNLPPASGLSSSSALVCASALATTLFLNEPGHRVGISSKKLAEDCSKFEHLIGTHGGGMDQAVIMTAQDGFAKYVQFMPNLECRNVRLPDDVVWLVSHCGSDCVKAATTGFNTRVLETKLAAALIVDTHRFHNVKSITIDRNITLGIVMDQLFSGESTKLILPHLSLLFLNVEPKISLSQLAETFQTSREVLIDLLSHKDRLLSRVEHVFEEAERVKMFRSYCESPYFSSYDYGLLGKLMTESHYSLRDKYDCSHPDLDRLVKVALDAGALGARLTGAGWGGCIVAMVHKDRADCVYERLKAVSSFTFRTEPRAGCSIIEF